MRLFGIRHLSTAGAWHVRRFLDEVRPELVLIESPHDTEPLIDEITRSGVKPPLAVLWETLSAEIAELKSQIETMRSQLPGLATRERSIDPDLLGQELLISRGYLPGDEAKAKTDRRTRDMEKNATLDVELEALKTKMSHKA